MGKKARAASLLLCLALLLAACGATPEPEGGEPASGATPEPEPVFTLWLAGDLPLCAAVTSLAADYAAQSPALAPVVRRFADTREMLAALDGETPDLLLCTEREAAALLASHGLGMLSFPDEPEPLFREAPGVAESGFFPLGAELPVLVLRKDESAQLEGCDSMEALCETAGRYAAQTGRPFFSADSFARLFAGLAAQKGAAFQAQRAIDAQDERFREIYNLLADCAWEGGLVPADGPVTALVEAGELVCGVCGSASLPGSDREALTVLPVPPLRGCEALVETRLCGLAVLPGADSEKAERFFGWLYADGRAARAAIGQGLAPAIGGEAAQDEPFAEGLTAAARSCRALFLPADGGLAVNGAAFEREYRAALALLG